MATNLYFSPKVKSEQYMYEDLVIEAVKMYGQDVYYLPRTIFERDFILNETIESHFNDAYIIESYIENVEGFEGEGNLFSKFGLEIRDEATFIFAKRTWEQAVGNWEVDMTRPNEGDLIYMPMAKSLFQISFVEHESPFYQLSNIVVYKVQASLYEATEGDTFQTGTTIDEIEHDNDVIVKVFSDMTDSSGLFAIGDEVYQDVDGTIIQGIISNFTPSDDIGSAYHFDIINIKTDSGAFLQFVEGARLYTIGDQKYANITSIGFNPGDPGSQNDVFETTADDIIDFSETNPFGEIT